MKIPDLKLFNTITDKERNQSNEEVIEINHRLIAQEKPERYNYSFIGNPNDLAKTITKIEKYVRQCYEYKRYIKYIRDSLDINSCFFFNNAKLLPHNKFHIEIHHGPYSLFDITSVIFSKHSLEKGPSNIDFFEIANEVLEVHFNLEVGLIPLSITAHELVHDGSLFIPLDYYFGDFMGFNNHYHEYISPDLIDKLALQRELTDKWYSHGEDKNTPYILEKGFTYLKTDDFKIPERIE